MSKLFARFAKDESGATAIEYGLICALMSLAVIAAVTALETPLNNAFTGIGKTLENQAPVGGAAKEDFSS